MPEHQEAAIADGELKAMNLIVAALKPLREEERKRALEYVLVRFGTAQLQTQSSSLAAPPLTAGAGTTTEAPPAIGTIHDIRSLKEAKRPKSANEMAALVAYYLSELAPVAERKTEIAKADIEQYFKSGGFRLPADANFTLVNAKDAGYLDRVSSGKYKLNPVGYNLVVHRMGARDSEKQRPRTRKGTRRTRKRTNHRPKH